MVAQPLSRKDLDADVDAINSSIETIRTTRSPRWPMGEIDESYSLLNLAWHERQFRDGMSYAYVIYDKQANYVGCFYLFPMGHRTKLTKELFKHDVDINWWVTTEAFKNDYYEKVYEAIIGWLKVFPVKNPYYSNKQLPSALSAE